ncbi:MAG: hypothetical protein A2087_14655 [Spirochaetes bacterium GWD1_61_31]|nr:MAG: hypothetical protein A2Y37_09325 [Spirochaetes bacterium GWB1_60_80]OHD31618.1 MAG: hypothetical protein A2004_09540 [Spirochaetes bacterium GWC1_61_12]OHD35016.1 MAG: hypothetical protein A2087_14655 [Spirochaetes bacterium GWD1_61_31]OHD44036.1 MAG: hypothetical protein A2Y35_01725 [Spirochaetes bacterium GWE1_60_18]OHD59071.1 MAG: hypothetical protein A2Y32_02445 [Spirochaetes bacterium GWF1_60_12]
MKPVVHTIRRGGFAILLLALTFTLAACLESASSRGLLPGLYARLETSRGTIIVHLDYDKAPLAVANFVGLAEGTLDASWNKPFYDSLTFHKIMPGLLVQSGCPYGDGTGTAGYIFPDEYHPSLRHDAAGVMGYAQGNSNDTNSSQFYITMAPLPFLDDKYTIFGRVVVGLDLLEKIALGDVLESVIIERVGQAAVDFRCDQEAWQEYFDIALEGARIRMQMQRQTALAGIQRLWPEMRPGLFDILTASLQEGSGPKPEVGAAVKVHYKGMLADGTVFDQTNPAGDPYSFELGVGQVIEGWDVVVGNMRQGEKLRVAIPPEMAYGSEGYADIIPGNSFLVFEIELVDF